MDLPAALALSLPLAAALAGSLYWISVALGRRTDLEHALRADELAGVVRAITDSFAAAAETIAEAHVRAARYQARAIKVRPKPDAPEDEHPFETWQRTEGHRKPERVQLLVEWSVGKILGVESDEQGSREDAERNLALLAPGLLALTEQYRERQVHT